MSQLQSWNSEKDKHQDGQQWKSHHKVTQLAEDQDEDTQLAEDQDIAVVDKANNERVFMERQTIL